MSKEQIRIILVEILKPQYSHLDFNDSLLSQIESISIVTLIILLEKTFLIEVQPTEMNERNFSNLEAVVGWLEKKINSHATR